MAIRVAEDADPNAQMSKVIGDRLLRTGMHAARTRRTETGVTPRLLVAPGFTSTRPTGGVALIAITSAGSDGRRAGYRAARS